MRILVVSETGLNLGIAMRCDGDGHDVRYLTSSNGGNGLIKSMTEEEAWHPDFFVYDHNKQVKSADSLRAEGFKVLGPSRWSAMLDSDPTYKKQIIASLGWNTEGTNGTHFYITAWFNGANFICNYSSIIYRRFMPGGAGPDLKCTGMLSCFNNSTERVYGTFLKPLEKMLKKVNHRGCVHIQVLANGEQYCVKDISASFMHPLSLVMYENTNLSTSDVLLKLFDETSKPIKTIDRWACGVKMSVPPYPYTLKDMEAEVEGIVGGNLKHLWLAEIKKDSDKYYTLNRGLIGYITARGNDENECVRRMYRTVSNIKACDLQYRNDVGRNVQSLLNSLRQSDWLAK